jgi:voltage-gated potassium channel
MTRTPPGDGHGANRPIEERRAERDRWALLRELDRLTERPMLVLSFIWLLLVAIDLIRGLPTALEQLTLVIWGLFIVDFAVELLIAPDRTRYLRRNVLTILALALPALRLLRVAPALRALHGLRAIRSVRLLQVVTSANRGLRALGRTFSERGFGYVVTATLLVALLGAAGMLAFEGRAAMGEEGAPAGTLVGPAFENYFDALWWTVMIVATIGSGDWPVSPEGRMLTLLLAVYGFVVFGYITATLASHFLGGSKEAERVGRARAEREIARLGDEIAALRAALADDAAPGSSAPHPLPGRPPVDPPES